MRSRFLVTFLFLTFFAFLVENHRVFLKGSPPLSQDSILETIDLLKRYPDTKGHSKLRSMSLLHIFRAAMEEGANLKEFQLKGIRFKILRGKSHRLSQSYGNLELAPLKKNDWKKLFKAFYKGGDIFEAWHTKFFDTPMSYAFFSQLLGRFNHFSSRSGGGYWCYSKSRNQSIFIMVLSDDLNYKNLIQNLEILKGTTPSVQSEFQLYWTFAIALLWCLLWKRTFIYVLWAKLSTKILCILLIFYTLLGISLNHMTQKYEEATKLILLQDFQKDFNAKVALFQSDFDQWSIRTQDHYHHEFLQQNDQELKITLQNFNYELISPKGTIHYHAPRHPVILRGLVHSLVPEVIVKNTTLKTEDLDLKKFGEYKEIIASLVRSWTYHDRNTYVFGSLKKLKWNQMKLMDLDVVTAWAHKGEGSNYRLLGIIESSKFLLDEFLKQYKLPKNFNLRENSAHRKPILKEIRRDNRTQGWTYFVPSSKVSRLGFETSVKSKDLFAKLNQELAHYKNLFFIWVGTTLILLLLFLARVKNNIRKMNLAVSNQVDSPNIGNWGRDESNSLLNRLQGISKKLVEKKRLSPFVASEILDLFRDQNGNLQTQLEDEGVILFSDVKSFTSLSQSHSPDEIVNALNRYFDIFEKNVSRYNGVIEKFIGDAIVVIFFKRFGEDFEQRSLECVMKIQEQLQNYYDSAHGPSLKFENGYGLSLSKVRFQIIGGAHKRHFFCDSDAMFEAEDLEALSRFTKSSNIIVSKSLMKQVEHLYNFQALDEQDAYEFLPS